MGAGEAGFSAFVEADGLIAASGATVAASPVEWPNPASCPLPETSLTVFCVPRDNSL